MNCNYPAWLLLVRPCCCEIFALSIYLFFSRKNGLLFFCSLIASIFACHSERCLPVAGRFITVLIGIVSIPISHGVLSSRLTLAFD